MRSESVRKRPLGWMIVACLVVCPPFWVLVAWLVYWLGGGK
jgi:hypothetical protein